MRKKKKKEDSEYLQAKQFLKEKLGGIKSYYEEKRWNIKTKQAMVKEILNVYREEYTLSLPTKNDHDFFFILEQKEGMEFTGSWYTPGKSKGSYKVKENAWGIKLVEGEDKKYHFSRVGNCPIILPEDTPGHMTLLSKLQDKGVVKVSTSVDPHPWLCLCVLRVNRAAPYQRMPKPAPPKGYTEFLPLVVVIKMNQKVN